MPDKFDRCVKEVMASGKSEDQAYAICTAQFNDSAEVIHRGFSDLATYSSNSRTAISIRDGVLEYLGAELGLDPADKIFTVYRSPATIANACFKMAGIPLTNEHIEMVGAAPDNGSRVESGTVIDQIDESTHSRLAVMNKLTTTDEMNAMLAEKRQLSLGYEADLVPHSRWDFEQINIAPHHLAAVRAGRCGPLCSFLDRKPQQSEEDTTMLLKAFLDADGAVNLEQVAEIAMALPEAIRKVPVDKLQELLPAMQEIMMYAKEQGVTIEAEGEMEDEETKMEDEDPGINEDEGKDPFADSAEFKDAVAKASKGLAAKIADAEVKRFATVVTKAQYFLDEDYDFTGKSTNDVMRDALATQHDSKFEDSELDVAFKMLKRIGTDLRQFGDQNPESGLAGRIEKSLED